MVMPHLNGDGHENGAKNLIAIASFIMYGLSLTAVISGLIPQFTEDVSRAVNAGKAENKSISESGGPLKMEIHVDKEQSAIDIQ
ncbi:hypothetical protein L6452_32507 [Arctium lappa]|uniref:Uncharacterized protein n=1 Tax=Arctium lappa TaxID=4217 RepID=A0ACB8Z5F8_ARCLA|nr:hypothetical protein L6452_32507 [Arctium lappa]